MCDQHFEETDFYYSDISGRKLLKKSAVPTRNAPNSEEFQKAEGPFVKRPRTIGIGKAAREIAQKCAESKAKNIFSKRSSPNVELLNTSTVQSTKRTSSGIIKVTKERIINQSNLNAGCPPSCHIQDHDYAVAEKVPNNSELIVLTPVTKPPDFVKKKVAELIKSGSVSTNRKLPNYVKYNPPLVVKQFGPKKEKCLTTPNIGDICNEIGATTFDLNEQCSSKSSPHPTQTINSNSRIVEEDTTSAINFPVERLLVNNDEGECVSEEKGDTRDSNLTNAGLSKPQKFKPSSLQHANLDVKCLFNVRAPPPDLQDKNEIDNTNVSISGNSNGESVRLKTFERTLKNNSGGNPAHPSILTRQEEKTFDKFYYNPNLILLKNRSHSSNLLNYEIPTQNKKNPTVESDLNAEQVRKTSSGIYRTNPNLPQKNKPCLDKPSNIVGPILDKITTQSKTNIFQRCTSSGVFKKNTIPHSKIKPYPTEFDAKQIKTTLESNAQTEIPIVGSNSPSTLTNDSCDEPCPSSNGNMSPKTRVLHEHLKRVEYLSRKKTIKKYPKQAAKKRKTLLKSKYSAAAFADSMGIVNPHERPVNLEEKSEWKKLYLPSLVSKSFPRLNEAYIQKMVNVLRARLPKLQPRDQLDVSFLLSVMSAYPGAPEYVKELLTQRLNILYIATLFQWDTAIALAMKGCDKNGPDTDLTVPSIPLTKRLQRIRGIKYPRVNPNYFNPKWEKDKIKVPKEALKPPTFAFEVIVKGNS